MKISRQRDFKVREGVAAEGKKEEGEEEVWRGKEIGEWHPGFYPSLRGTKVWRCSCGKPTVKKGINKSLVVIIVIWKE